jgi:hypothetical protein
MICKHALYFIDLLTITINQDINQNKRTNNLFIINKTKQIGKETNSYLKQNQTTDAKYLQRKSPEN